MGEVRVARSPSLAAVVLFAILVASPQQVEISVGIINFDLINQNFDTHDLFSSRCAEYRASIENPRMTD